MKTKTKKTKTKSIIKAASLLTFFTSLNYLCIFLCDYFKLTAAWTFSVAYAVALVCVLLSIIFID
jgi:hypothetical protein